MTDLARLTLDIDPGLHEKLQVLAARQGITMRELCLRAIEHEALDEEPSHLTGEEAPLLAEL